MLSSDDKDTFLSLVRLGIGHYSCILPKIVEWNAIEALAAVSVRTLDLAEFG